MRMRSERIGLWTVESRSACVGLVWALGLMSWGCSKEEAPAPQAAAAPVAQAERSAQPADAPAEAAPGTEPSDAVHDATFSLRAKPAGPYNAGELGRFVIEIEPRGEYHINEDYPVAVEVEAPEGVTLPKAQLAKADASRFDAEAAAFDVPFTAGQAGEHTIRAKVAFAVCTDENCIPEERNLALALAVQ